MDDWKYDREVTHKAIFFGPGDGSGRRRPRTALCKLVAQNAGKLPRGGVYHPIDEKLCKRNWKDVQCEECISIREDSIKRGDNT